MQTGDTVQLCGFQNVEIVFTILIWLATSSGCDVREVYGNPDFLIDRFFDKIGDWDTAVVTLTFKNGALATLDKSRKAVYGYDQRLEMFGFEGMIAISKLWD